MNLQTLPYVLVYYAAFLVSIGVFIYSWMNRKAPGVRVFAIAVLLELSWLAGYVIEIYAKTQEAKVFWDNFQFIGSFFAPIGLLIFALQFIGWKGNARQLATILGIIPVVVLIVIFTNFDSQLVRVNTQVTPGIPYAELTYDYGTVTSLGNYYLYLVSLVYIVILIAGFRNKDANFRSQLWIVLLGTGIPIVGLILGQYFGFKFANQRDTSPLLFVISNAVIAFGVFRFRLFNLIPVARDALFEILDDVLIILDQDNLIVDANAPAMRLLSAEGVDPIGAHIKTIFPGLYSQFGDVTEIHTEITADNNTIYDLKITPLKNRTDKLIGRLITAHDITSQKKVERELQFSNEQSQRRAAQFKAVANVASATTTLQNQEQTLARVVQTISEQLGHYHVGIFLIDESRKYAILKASNSEGGKRMLERGHRLEVGEVGIVGNVAATGRPRIALDIGTDAVYFNNPDLPQTRSEVSLPLIQGKLVIGVLDVQSTAPNAFNNDDMETLSILASQVSITIQNTSLYEENIAALETAESAYRQLSGETWKEALKAQPLKGYVYDGIKSQPLTQGVSSHSISIPVNVRGQNIGALKLESLSPNRDWTEDELAMIKAAAERAALALENARLLTESQKRAAKERIIGEISAKISAQIEVDDLLRTAAMELTRSLPNTEIAIQFNANQETKNV